MREMARCFIVFILLMSMNSVFSQNQVEISRREDLSLTIYQINYSKIDMAYGTMPEQDSDVVFCCAASFTGQKLGANFNHLNIADNHVGGGVFHKGYSCRANNGYFAFYPNSMRWAYSPKKDKTINLLDSAVTNKGMCFGQVLVVYKGEIFPDVYEVIEKSHNCYRVVAELNGKLCVIDSDKMAFVDFRQKLIQLGVKNAVYMDMGRGWNYSFYRNNGEIKYIHNEKELSCTNWIVFYK